MNDIYAGARKELQGILEYQREVFEDHSKLSNAITMYEDLIAKYPQFQAAEDAESKFREAIETLSENLAARVMVKVKTLKKQGIAEIFTPGTDTKDVVEWITKNVQLRKIS